MRRTFILISALLLTSASWADGGHDHGKMAGEKLGDVHFPISCGAASQKEFDRAMAMQHSFWFEEAYKAFRDLAAKDPQCAMAHWGVAMSQYHPLWNPPSPSEFMIGTEAVEKARAAKKATSRERKYVNAISAYYNDADKQSPRERAVKYQQAMGALSESEPKDTEAAILYALALDATADPKDKTYANQKHCGEILEPIFAKQPQHPGLAHYIIHCYDNPALAAQGLNAARAYAKIAPSVPHALHMPSHIFTRLGLWDESIASNAASAAAGRKYEQETKMAGMWDQTAHPLDYQQYALLQQGRVAEAQKIVDLMRTSPAADINLRAAAYGFASTSARQAVETEDWQAAAALIPQNSKERDADANIYLARAMGAARIGNVPAAQRNVDQLVEIEKSLTDPYWKGQAEIKRLEGQAWLAFADNRGDEALNLAREAAAKEDATDKNPVTPGALRPAHEVFADLLLETKHYSAAAKEYQASLQIAPGRFHALYGAAKASELANDRENARKFYAELLKVAEKGDAERPELEAAKKFVASAQVAKN
jgi:hypothetical protein